MGTINKIQRLTDDQIVAEYTAGASQGWLSLRARISQAQVRDVLIAKGVRIRQSAEALRLHLRTAPPRASTVRALERQRRS